MVDAVFLLPVNVTKWSQQKFISRRLVNKLLNRNRFFRNISS